MRGEMCEKFFTLCAAARAENGRAAAMTGVYAGT